jgi:hypothetical protein
MNRGKMGRLYKPTHHSNAPKIVMTCKAWHRGDVHNEGLGSDAPRAMKPANQNTVVTASAVRSANLWAIAGTKLGLKVMYGTAMSQVQRPQKSIKLASS